MALLSEIQKRQYSWNKLIIQRINWKYLRVFYFDLIWERLTWMAGISKTWIKWWSSLNTHRRPKYDITTFNYVKTSGHLTTVVIISYSCPLWFFTKEYYVQSAVQRFWEKLYPAGILCLLILLCQKLRKGGFFFFNELKPIYKPLKSWAKPLKPFSLMWFYIPTFMLPPKSHVLKCLLRENNVI